MRGLFVVILINVIPIGAFSGPAGAQTLAQKAQADSLFDEAKQDMAAGKIAEACAAFEASYKIVARLGTELNLADCYGKSGRTASAWAAFREAQGIAKKSSDPRADFAGQQATALEPRLNHIIVNADGTATDVELDGQPVILGGKGVPVDAGKHTVTAKLPTGQFQRDVDVSGEGQAITIEVTHESVVKRSTPPAPLGGSGRSRSSWPGVRVAGVATAGVGVVLLGVAAGVTVAASSTWASGKSDCSSTNLCGPKGAEAFDRAGRLADVGTITSIAGAACVATGVVLFLVGKPHHLETALAPALLPGGGALVAAGRF
jgi:hypothetical protein